jgi:hypothetical protein
MVAAPRNRPPQNVLETIAWLQRLGLPVLPVAPKQDPFRYPKRDKSGNLEYEEDGVTPKPLFTGKNPSYLDRNGTPQIIKHQKYHDKLPTDKELQEWFANPANGIGTLGGWCNTVWIDFDVKQFGSKEECDATVTTWLQRFSDIKQTFCEITHSGGWRFGIKVKNKPDFTNFALSPGGKHVGECLGHGRFTVLAPTIGPSGNSYQNINRDQLVEVESLEKIGIFPSRKAKNAGNAMPPASPLVPLENIPGTIPLDLLLTDRAKAILNGDNPTGDRSEALTILANEAFGWENWCTQNCITVRDNAAALLNHAGQKLGVDSDRVARILKTINIAECLPSALHLGEGKSCWLKIRRLDKATFEAKCPASIKMLVIGNSDYLAKPTSTKGGGSSGGDEPPITELSLRDRILEILSRSQSRSEREAALLQLAKSIRDINLRDLRDLAKTLEEEIEIGDNLDDAKSKVRELVKHQEARLNPGQVLYGDGGVLADLIEKVADAMPAHPEDILTALIPVVFSRLGAETEIVISPSSGYTQPAIGQSMVVKATGEKKTPIVNVAIKPLLDLEAQLHKQYKLAEEDYSRDLKEYNDSLKKRKKGEDIAEELQEPQKPARKRFILSNCTIEALMRIHAENPDGLLQWKDEASSYITGRNKYRAKGAGDDLEIDLSLFSGGALVKDTVDESKAVFLEKSAVSRTGATQTERLKDLMKDHSDVTGEFARWLFCALPPKKDYINLFDDSDYGQRLRIYLKDFYQLLSNLPRQQYFLDSAAKAVFQECQHKLVNTRDSEPQLGLKAAYPKFESYLARLSLWIHVANSALAGEAKPSQMIDALAVSVAWETVQFYMAQLQILYAKNNPEQELEGTLLKIKNFVCDRNGVTVREIKRGISELKRGKTSINQIEEMCSSLIQDGFISQRDKKYYPPSCSDIGDNLGTSGDKTGDTSLNLETVDISPLSDKQRQRLGTNWGQTGDKLSPPSNDVESMLTTTSGDSGDNFSTLPNKKEMSPYNFNLLDKSVLSGGSSIDDSITNKVSPLSPEMDKTIEPQSKETGDKLSPDLSPVVPEFNLEIDESIDNTSSGTVSDSVPTCPQSVPTRPQAIAIGTRVRIIYPASARHGMTGTVRKLDQGSCGLIAEVRLDDKSLRANLRAISVAVPGDDLQRLEVL